MSESAQEVRMLISREKRGDRLLRAVAIGAWAVTLGLLLVYGAMVASEVSNLQRMVELGLAQQREVYSATIPLIAAAGTVSLILAALATIGIFLRLRAATLNEIQLRLATLESMIAAGADAD